MVQSFFALAKVMLPIIAGISVIISARAQSDALPIQAQRYQPQPYVPESVELYDTIVKLDSLYFDTYNKCNLEKMAKLMSDDLEFYHDKGGLTTSKTEFLESIKKNICGKVTREVAPGSIEVYPIQGYGAVEIGYHRFHNNMEPPGTPSKDSKFIVIWQKQDGEWRMSRVVSLH